MNTDNQNVIVTKSLIDYCINPTDITRLEQLSLKECRQILPFLVRIWKRSSNIDEAEMADFKTDVLDKLRLFDDINKICAYLNSDFNQIYDDVIKQLSARLLFSTMLKAC